MSIGKRIAKPRHFGAHHPKVSHPSNNQHHSHQQSKRVAPPELSWLWQWELAIALTDCSKGVAMAISVKSTMRTSLQQEQVRPQ
eukprot:9489140-Pyramimonas_sp.AAC.1